ncbi:MAG: hypothetical protein H0X15_06245 [Acidobacteria bacterium]|jgi:hypothetical protein|nr:hypothetical protein [Acidobacteriota bacterium]MBA3785124.1 hypothetical protein [Acidobacteriota bacterium]MBA4122622.1 hypothetical protein [Acidobacteriota bacterium]
MKFLIDAQLPYRLKLWLIENSFDSGTARTRSLSVKTVKEHDEEFKNYLSEQKLLCAMSRKFTTLPDFSASRNARKFPALFLRRPTELILYLTPEQFFQINSF